MNTTDSTELMIFLSKLLTRNWNAEVVTQFQLDVFVPIKLEHDILINLFNEVKKCNSNEKNMFGINMKNNGFVVTIKCYQAIHYDKQDYTTPEVVQICGELFELMTREICEVKKLTSIEIKCLFNLGVCYYMPEEVDCAVANEDGQPSRPINVLFTRITNGNGSLTYDTIYKKMANLQQMVDKDTFIKMIHIVPSSRDFVILYGDLYQPLCFY